MRTLRSRLRGAADNSSWRAPGDSCVVESGDEDELDLDALRAEVRAAGAPLSADAAAVAEIIRNWEKTRSDYDFAMRTRFFPSGVKIPGVKWTV